MGYFSNGTEGMLYEEKWCDNCIHQVDCPVWSIHLEWSYELCNKKDDPGKQMLDEFIPIDENGRNQECTMFVEK